MYTYQYPRPALTVDSVVFGIGEKDEELKVLFIQRKNEPFKGMWAIPGGFIELDETCAEAAARELEEETGLKNIPLTQFHVFDAIDRDPRERIITVVHYGFADLKKHTAQAGDDAANVIWIKLSEIPQLAADHNQILEKALEAIKPILSTK